MQVELKRLSLTHRVSMRLPWSLCGPFRWSAQADAGHKADGNAGQLSLGAAWAVRYAAIPFKVIQLSHQGVGHGGSEVFVRGQPDQ